MQVLKLPKSGKAMEEGTVMEWQAAEGDEVSEGDVVVVIESDKSAVELTAEQDGVLLDISVQEGETVAVGTELGRVGSPDEADEESTAAEPDAPDDGPSEVDADTASAVTPTESAPAGAGEADGTDTGPVDPTAGVGDDSDGEPVRATPTARRIARERGVPIEAVMANVEDGVSVRPDHVEAYDSEQQSSGETAAVGTEILGSPYARVVAADRGVSIAEVGEALGTDRVREAHVEHYVEEYDPVGHGSTDAAEVNGESDTVEAGAATGERAVREDRRIDGAAGVMYERMGQVAREYASTTTVQRVDVTDLVDLYERLAPAWERQGDSLSLTAFVVRAVAHTLPEYDEINAELTGEKSLRVYEDVNVGIAVDSDRGLVVPTIFDADERSLRDVSEEIDRLAEKARSGSLGPDEMQGGTFTVSNAGSLGAYMNTPQINPPQTAILGVCEVFDEPGIVDGDVVSCKKMHLCLTYDHRVVDGATAVGFVSDVADLLERPETLLS